MEELCRRYGISGPTGIVPEPGTAALLGLAGMAFPRRAASRRLSKARGLSKATLPNRQPAKLGRRETCSYQRTRFGRSRSKSTLAIF